MCRVGRSLPAGPATTPQASSGWSRRAWATISSRIALSMVSTSASLPCARPVVDVAMVTRVDTCRDHARTQRYGRGSAGLGQRVEQGFLQVAQVRVDGELEH